MRPRFAALATSLSGCCGVTFTSKGPVACWGIAGFSWAWANAVRMRSRAKRRMRHCSGWQMYHGIVSFPAKIAGFVRKHGMIWPGERVGVAVSGGADSVALLHALVELRR